MNNIMSKMNKYDQSAIGPNKFNIWGRCIDLSAFYSYSCLLLNLFLIPEEGYLTCGWTGVCRLVFRKLPPSNY